MRGTCDERRRVVIVRMRRTRRAVAVTTGTPRPLIAHVVYRFDVGGLENGLVNLLNRMSRERYRHVVVSLTDATDFRQRVTRDDVDFIELHKAPGHGIKLLPRLFALFRRLRPAVVHTRNLAALEASLPAWLSGVPLRIHGEHGRDVGDLDGTNRTYRAVRRAYRPFVSHYIALSRDLERYLVETVGVEQSHVTNIVNGVDIESFTPRTVRAGTPGSPFGDPALWICGTVGRLQPVKNQALLAHAFVRALADTPSLRSRMRLVIVGDGPMHGEIRSILERGGVADLAWLTGARTDVADLLRMLDVFVLPSLAEGISNTILEAMATGLPVVATDVGGNGELIDGGRTGVLVQSGDVAALADALARYANAPEAARLAGLAGRARAEQLYALDAMVAQYEALYERLLARSRRAGRRTAAEATARLTTGSD
jgi:sugar transferase (PEP-CTERM/EpsH1 system associated)